MPQKSDCHANHFRSVMFRQGGGESGDAENMHKMCHTLTVLIKKDLKKNNLYLPIFANNLIIMNRRITCIIGLLILTTSAVEVYNQCYLYAHQCPCINLSVLYMTTVKSLIEEPGS